MGALRERSMKSVHGGRIAIGLVEILFLGISNRFETCWLGLLLRRVSKWMGS